MLDGSGLLDPLDLEMAAGAPAAAASTTVDNRQLNPSSRMGGLIISEIMYNPVDPDGVGALTASDVEFVEIYNSEEVSNDMSGYELTGEIDFVFPEGTVISGRSYIVVASNPVVAEWHYGIVGVLGPFSGNLNNDGGTLRLRNQMNAILQDIQYDDDYPWPAAADGAGHSLVMTRPDFGEDSVEAWEASDYVDGNPGTYNQTFTDNLANIKINEVMAHTDLPDIDFIELYNHSNSTVSVSGLRITDDTDPSDPGYVEYTIPGGTSIAPRGHLMLDQNTLGFSLDMQGDRVYLRDLSRDRMIDAVKFGAMENGVSLGRLADGADEFRVMSAPTPGTANAEPANYDVVINEVMYHPISQNSDDEFIELYNRGASPVVLDNWRFTEGVRYTFPVGTTIGAGEYLVIAKDALRLIAANPG
ncbi:MAG: lamin tail domain-containing protein, partial [Phycisphaerae bacterium]|nr:lamin tail domain-containing protein [Phycisphaerae bacterium]